MDTNEQQDDEDKRYAVYKRIEITARKLEGFRADSFVDTKNLCRTCKHATITRQASKNNRMINCSIVGKNVPDDIVECSDYTNILTLNLSQMSDIAILLNNRAEPAGGYL